MRCSECGKKLWFFKTYKTEDGSILCESCFTKRKKEFIERYVREYIQNREDELCALPMKEIRLCFQSHDSLDVAIEKFKHRIDNIETKLKRFVRSGSITEIDSLAEKKEKYRFALSFLCDLDKFHRFFNHRGFKVSHQEIIEIFYYLIEEIKEKRWKEDIDGLANTFYKRLSNKLKNRNIDARSIAWEYIATIDTFLGWEILQNNYINIFYVYLRLLNKFGVECEENEAIQIFAKTIEEYDIKKFENTIKLRKKSIEVLPDINNLQILDGKKFEEYLRKLFDIMGYISIITPHTRDQGADLILYKNGKKSSSSS